MTSDAGQGDGGGDTNIQVFVRVRPPSPDEPAFTRVVDVDPSYSQVILRQQTNPRIFSFDHVADTDSKQEDIFQKLGKKVIENCMDGYNGTIFAYTPLQKHALGDKIFVCCTEGVAQESGQTGSGKTFTMMGPSEDAENFQHEQRGVIPRSFEYLYNLIARERELHGDNKQFLCKCSFLEIYNEQIFDLLEPSSVSLQLRESFKTGVYVAGLSEKVVADANEAYEVLSSSWMNRKVASTSMNRESSRSHAVFTLQVESKFQEWNGGPGNIKTASLNLVDLAGSESQKDTGASGLRLKEAGSINKSLSNLGNVIMALVSVARDSKKRFIPYRDSKLTFLLRDSFGGNSRTSLIACVHPGHKCIRETLSTLLFAKRAKLIKNRAVLNENASGNVQELQGIIKTLKEELQQYKMGNISAEPSLGKSMPELRKMFLQAMVLRQKLVSEKQELKNTMEKLRDVCDKKDRTIQTNKMIIKFRDNTIKRLEEKLKGADVLDTEKEDLLKEIDALRSQVEHHPLVAKHAMDVQRLKSAVKSLKEDSGILAGVHEDAMKVQLLEEEYDKLITEQEGNSDDNQITPQRVDKVSTATLEKLKSQNEELESRIEQLKMELSESKKTSEKNEMFKDGEIASYKRTVEELENVIEANKMRSKLEKAALNEQHLQTVMTITTPKKECYKLRSRTVVTDADTPDLNNTIPFENEKSPEAEALPEEEGILQEDMPEEVEQQAYEALLDQIKSLQENNASLEARIDEYETDRVKQLHNQSVTESKHRSTEELLEKEKQIVSSLREKCSQIELKLKAANEEKENAVGEAGDLRLVLTQVDKDLKEYKEKVKALEKEKKEKIEEMVSKIGDLSQTLDKVDKEKERLLEAEELLQLRFEEEEALRDYQENLALKLEKKVIEQQEAIKKLEQDLQNAEKTILDEREHRESLVEQLACESTEKDKELVKKFEENKNLMMECTSLKNVLEACEDNITILKNSIAEKDSKILQLEKSLKSTEEKVVQYYNRLEEQNDAIMELKQKLDSETEQVNFYKEKEETAAKCIEELKSNLARKVEEMETQKRMHSAEIEMLNEDTSACQEDLANLNEEMTKSQEQLQRSEEQCHILSEEVNTLKLSLKQRDETIQNQSSIELCALKETLKDLDRSRIENAKENSELKNKNEKLQQQYQDIVMELESLKSENQLLTEKMETQQEQITELLRRCSLAETRASGVESDRNKAQTRLMELECGLSETRTDLTEIKKINGYLREQEKRLLAIIEKDNNRIMNQKSELDAIKSNLKEVFQLFNVREAGDFEDLKHKIDLMRQENKKLSDLIGHNNLDQTIINCEMLKT